MHYIKLEGIPTLIISISKLQVDLAFLVTQNVSTWQIELSNLIDSLCAIRNT